MSSFIMKKFSLFFCRFVVAVFVVVVVVVVVAVFVVERAHDDVVGLLVWW